jgi:hypothetical protein
MCLKGLFVPSVRARVSVFVCISCTSIVVATVKMYPICCECGEARAARHRPTCPFAPCHSPSRSSTSHVFFGRRLLWLVTKVCLFPEVSRTNFW